jgi:hypothetical protein
VATAQWSSWGGRRSAPPERPLSKEAHRALPSPNGSPISAARIWESDPGAEPSREPESKSKVLHKEEPDLLWTREPESKEEPDLLWALESESKEEPDLLWTGEFDRVRHGKAFS